MRKKPSTVYWLESNLYLNITNRCPNNCYSCLKNYKDGVSGFNLKLKEEPAAQEVISELQKVINQKNWRKLFSAVSENRL